MFNGETGRDRIGNESATPDVLLSNRRKNTRDKQFFPLFSEFHEEPWESDKNREGGRQHIKSNREGWNLCFSLLYTAIPSPYVFQTINLAVTNTSCFLGTDISKQHHCVVLLLHFTRLHVSPCDVLLLLYLRRWRRVIRQCCCITRVVCNWCIAILAFTAAQYCTFGALNISCRVF